eukprot:Skav218477  [mRNA]  locus=scaffold538:1132075:1132350:+ [translate_table: standard]
MLRGIRTRWWSGASQRKKSLESDYIEQLVGLKFTRANFRKIIKALAERRRPEVILDVFSVAFRSRGFNLNERDFTVGILAFGRSSLWQKAC